MLGGSDPEAAGGAVTQILQAGTVGRANKKISLQTAISCVDVLNSRVMRLEKRALLAAVGRGGREGAIHNLVDCVN